MSTKEITWLVLVSAGYVAGIACALHALLHKTREASGALIWIAFCLGVPWVGAFAYVTIGDDRILGRRRRKIRAAHAEFRAAHGSSAPSDVSWRETLRRAHLGVLTDNEVVRGNRLDVMVGGAAAYDRMIAAIRGARRSVALQTYILDEDEVGRRFRDAVVDRSRAGIPCRVLYDAIGASSASMDFLSSFADGGAKIHAFLPFHPLKRRWQINLRNHRKLLVVDGVDGFIGSMNLSARHVSSGRGASHDFMVSMRGPAVRDVLEIFASDWRFAAGEFLAREAFFPPIEVDGDDVVQVVDSGPDRRARSLHKVIVAAIYEARRDILMLTPYFVPPLPLLYALETAAARGVRVRILVPQVTDNRIVDFAMVHYFEPVLKAGAHVARKSGPMLHMKMLVVDDDLAIFGSTNMDNRSFFLNFEADLVAYEGPILAELRRVAEAEWRGSAPVTYESVLRAPLSRRIVTRTAALFAPIL